MAESFFGLLIMLELLEAGLIVRRRYHTRPRAAELGRGCGNQLLSVNALSTQAEVGNSAGSLKPYLEVG